MRFVAYIPIVFKMNVLLCLISLFILTSSKPLKDSFTEELLITPLPSKHVNVYFQFTTKLSTKYDVQHSHLFPQSVIEIIDRFNLQEFHVSLTQGLWRYDSWGYPVRDAAPGAELWAWFKPETEDVDHNWLRFAETLSGTFCASFNFIDKSNSFQPEFTFRPRGVVHEKHLNNSLLRYSALPQEIVCTENLTPWKKLLPCESKRGLATLLNSAYLHNSRFYSLGIDVRPVCADVSCEHTVLELTQSVTLIYDPMILGNQNWSFRKFFGQGLSGPCSLATKSSVYVDISINTSTPFTLSPHPDDLTVSTRGGNEKQLAIYEVGNIRKGSMINIAGTFTKPNVILVKIPPPLFATRYLTGYGQERGGIATRIYNNHWTSLDVVVLENLPWFLPVFLHTLKAETSDGRVIPLKLLRFLPGRERIRPYYLEVALQLPARSVITLSIDFDYVFLKWQEYPPDANHGFYVGSSIISCNLDVARNYTALPIDGHIIRDSFNASRKSYPVQIRTEVLLVTLPTPDFSMPYNVICLACTVVALAFGPLHNITTKRLKLQPKGEQTRKGLLASAQRQLAKLWPKKSK